MPSAVDPQNPVPTPNQPAEPEYETGETPPRSDAVLSPYTPLPGDFTAPGAPQKGCQKVDVLFVIDNSDSMDEEQANLARSFPAFITAMGQLLETQDFHIMVVGTDGEQEKEDRPTLDVNDCADVRGAGKRQNVSSVDCGIEGGLAFMTGRQLELSTTFSCAADVGTDGSAIEEPMDAMLEAVGAPLNARGRCNAGFLRDDAMLVVAFITDEEDDHSKGDPEDWRRLLLAAKGGREDAVVVLGLVGDNNIDGGLPGGPCRGADADASPRLQTFVDSFAGRGLVGSVCAADYSPFFALALSWVDGSCQEFVPPVIF